MSRGFCLLALLASGLGLVSAFDITRYDNLAVYWGQNSYGAVNSDDPAHWQERLSAYCQDDTIDIIPIAFLNTFFSTDNLPSYNLANTCNVTTGPYFSGTQLMNCGWLAPDIETCQSKGKIVTISLGGAGAGVGFQSDSQAEAFADQIWDLFLGGSSSTRPFGSAVLDGVDLDIEGGTTTGYTAFVTQLRTHFSGASKKYYVTGAPQCVYPDASLGSTLNSAEFDAVFVQFYNNQCGLQAYGEVSDWNFGIWDYWARNISPNKNVKVFIGAPASSTAAGTGYQDVATLSSIAKATRDSFPSFGGVMLWDASQAYANGRYDEGIKNALVADGGTGFTFPNCSAPAFVAGDDYSGGSQVTYQGYTWQAKWWASDTPAASSSSSWTPISACTGSGGSPTSPPGSSPTGGSSCAGVAAWDSSSVYTGGQQVSYNGDLWTAKWWTQGDTPGGSAGVWQDDGACASAAAKEVKTTQIRSAETAAPKRNSRLFRL